MAEFPETFDPAAVPEDDRAFELIPAGDYQMQVIESEIKPTKDNTGQQLVLTHEIISGPLANRRLWDRLNIRNANADAQRISQRALADLCLATGVATLKDSEELHFKPFTGKVGVKKATQKDIDAGYPDDKNTVRYKPKGAGSAAISKPAPNQTSASKPAQQQQGDKPWKKSA